MIIRWVGDVARIEETKSPERSEKKVRAQRENNVRSVSECSGSQTQVNPSSTWFLISSAAITLPALGSSHRKDRKHIVLLPPRTHSFNKTNLASQSGSRYTPLSNTRHDPLSTSSRRPRPNDNRSAAPRDGQQSPAKPPAAADAGSHVRTIKEWLATRVRGPGILDLHVRPHFLLRRVREGNKC